MTPPNEVLRGSDRVAAIVIEAPFGHGRPSPFHVVARACVQKLLFDSVQFEGLLGYSAIERIAPACESLILSDLTFDGGFVDRPEFKFIGIVVERCRELTSEVMRHSSYEAEANRGQSYQSK